MRVGSDGVEFSASTGGGVSSVARPGVQRLGEGSPREPRPGSEPGVEGRGSVPLARGRMAGSTAGTWLVLRPSRVGRLRPCVARLPETL